jgi:hypothetical protein
MSVQFGKKLPPTDKVYFEFRLPGQVSSVRLSGQVVWQDWNARAGIQFVDVPKFSRRLLGEFLGGSLASASQKKAFSAVTVQMEELLPFTPVAVGVEVEDQPKSEPGEGAALAGSGPDNRRGQTRYACRLGAEVYYTGQKVPHHCCLTDLSPGGCYLEVPLPFPKGTSVEITVRTYDLKLKVGGKVQTSHPGYGMGVVFELETKHECDQVQKLTDVVAANVSDQ